VDRALSVLGAFRSGDFALSLAVLAERTQMYKSTVLRLIASLEHAGMVQRLDNGHYALGSKIAHLHELYSASFSMERAVMPELRRLVSVTGESAAYHVRQGDARLCLYRVDSPHPVRDHIKAGDVLPCDRGTGGRVLTAFDSERAKSASAKDQRLYASIRKRGYYAAAGDRLSEVAGISAPVFNADGRIAAALTLSMPVHRYDERYVDAVLESALKLTGQQ
jgi:DNA-binding IclR family transcriptional regulator